MCVCVLTMGNWAGRTGSLNKDFAEDKAWGEAEGPPLLFVTPWTLAHQAPLSVGFLRQEYWSGLPCPPPGDLPYPGTELTSSACVSCIGRQILYHLSHPNPLYLGDANRTATVVNGVERCPMVQCEEYERHTFSKTAAHQ